MPLRWSTLLLLYIGQATLQRDYHPTSCYRVSYCYAATILRLVATKRVARDRSCTIFLKYLARINYIYSSFSSLILFCVTAMLLSSFLLFVAQQRSSAQSVASNSAQPVACNSRLTSYIYAPDMLPLRYQMAAGAQPALCSLLCCLLGPLLCRK